MQSIVVRFYHGAGGQSHRSVKLGLTSALVLAACMSPAERRREQQLPDRMQGSRTQESPSRRTAENRPRPWVEEKPPFEADRVGVGAYRARRQIEHTGGDGRLTSRECLQVLDHNPCPLLTHRWKARDVEGGILLATSASRTEATRVRAAVHCLHAHGREAKQSSCLGKFLPAAISGSYIKGELILRIVVADRRRVAEVRKRVRQMIAEAL